MNRVFEKGNKIWSIYTESDLVNKYLNTMRTLIGEGLDDFDERIQVTREFLITDPIGLVHNMVSITVICTDEEIEKIQTSLGLINC